MSNPLTGLRIAGFPGRYLQGPGALAALGTLVKEMGAARPVLISDDIVESTVGDAVRASLAGAGLTAATMARHGFVGPKQAYEGRFGLFNSHLGPLARDGDLGLATAGLGEVWELAKVNVKPLPACHFTHACADAAAILRAAGFEPGNTIGAPDRTVIATDPVAGALRVPGTKVDIITGSR